MGWAPLRVYSGHWKNRFEDRILTEKIFFPNPSKAKQDQIPLGKSCDAFGRFGAKEIRILK